MYTTRHIAGATAVLAALVLTMETPAEAQQRGERSDGSHRAGSELRQGGNFGGQLRGADLARARTGGSSAMRRMARSSGNPGYISSSAHSRNRSIDNRSRSARHHDHDRHDWDRRDHHGRDWSRHRSRDWDRRRYSRRDWDDRYGLSISIGSRYPYYSSYYSYPYYSSYYSYPSYGYGYTSPYAYYGYPFPYSGYTHYSGYSSYYGTGGYYW